MQVLIADHLQLKHFYSFSDFTSILLIKVTVYLKAVNSQLILWRQKILDMT